MSPFLPAYSVSFVLATYNRGSVVTDCLRNTMACAAAVLPADRWSVLVVDNGSTDGTADAVEALARKHSHLRLVKLGKNCGPVAKNVGIHGNDADLIVLLDDDAYPMPGALAQTLRHFHGDPQLGAAVFDVTLPDGRKEASAFPDVFIGAGTALRGTALKELERRFGQGGGLLPADFFMQAEEYDLSFRLLEAGWSVQRFWDMPLMHLKSPGARIGQRTTRLDVRNNLYLLARYVPEPLCGALAADWLARYWRMATARDAVASPHPAHGSHKANFMKGAAAGLGAWTNQRDGGKRLLSAGTLERIFKFEAITERLARVKERGGVRRIAFGDLGKNMLAYHRAAERLNLEVVAVVDDALAGEGGTEYRGVPVMGTAAFACRTRHEPVDAVVITAMSPVHAARQAEALRRTLEVPVVDLFSRGDALVHAPASAG
jgi:glycosyltransferase involved in cell wall biosynthesis